MGGWVDICGIKQNHATMRAGGGGLGGGRGLVRGGCGGGGGGAGGVQGQQGRFAGLGAHPLIWPHHRASHSMSHCTGHTPSKLIPAAQHHCRRGAVLFICVFNTQ